jgi:hypothetical protein
MDAFSFYFSFYGLILGLAVAQVASGFLNAVGTREEIKIGWLTPALAIFIFVDITSFWIYAWGIREIFRISWGVMYLGLLISLLYYFASGLVFPRKVEQWPDLDTYYWRHKRLVIGGILIPNLIAFTQTTISHPPTIDPVYIFAQGTYFPPVVLLLFSNRKWQDLTLLGVAIGGYLANSFLPNWLV